MSRFMLRCATSKPNKAYLSDFVDRNRYANNSATNFSTYGLINNQLLLAGDTPGAAFRWNPGRGIFALNAAYRAEQIALVNTTSIFGDDGTQTGIFNAPNLGVVELEIAPTQTTTFRLQYSRGTQGSSTYSVLGANLELALGRHVGLFGRFGYAFDFPGNIQAIAWSAGIAFPDLFRKGDIAGISAAEPLVLQDNVLGLFNATQTTFEAFYRFQATDNIAISPVFQVITNPGNEAIRHSQQRYEPFSPSNRIQHHYGKTLSRWLLSSAIALYIFHTGIDVF